MLYHIVVVSKNNVIGREGRLPYNSPVIESRLIKALTYDATVIVGRKTYENQGQDIDARKLLVVSRETLPLDEALAEVQDEPTVYILGGQSIFEQTIPMVAGIYAMEIEHYIVSGADAFYPAMPSFFRLRCKERIKDSPMRVHWSFYKRIWDYDKAIIGPREIEGKG